MSMVIRLLGEKRRYPVLRIPSRFAKALGIRPGDPVIVELQEEGFLLIHPLPLKLESSDRYAAREILDRLHGQHALQYAIEYSRRIGMEAKARYRAQKATPPKGPTPIAPKTDRKSGTP